MHYLGKQNYKPQKQYDYERAERNKDREEPHGGICRRIAGKKQIQGSAADIIKIAMVRIYERFCREGIKSKMILQVHDELNFSVLPEEKERVEKIVLEEMQNAYPLQVPLVADSGWGANWLEAH